MSKKAQKHGKILNISVTSTSVDQVLRFVRASLHRKTRFSIVTPNPEIILQAQKDKKLASILNSADISLPDGVGLVMASKFLSLPTAENDFIKPFYYIFQGLMVGVSALVNKKWLSQDLKQIRGREMFMELIKLANKKSWRVFFLGGENDEAQDVKKFLLRSYKKIKIETHKGPILSNSILPVSASDEVVQERAIKEINSYKPQLLFIAFGAPRQEKWMNKWVNKLNVGGAMVVGGTFNYISGRNKLPPKGLSDMGLEWLWRLATEPRRMVRIFRALIVFPLVVYISKLRK